MNPVAISHTQSAYSHVDYSLLRANAAPCSVYIVHPLNKDKMPCLISGYKVCQLQGQEVQGLVLFTPLRGEQTMQHTAAASGVPLRRPLLVPIQGMHPQVPIAFEELNAPHIVRLKIAVVVDALGNPYSEQQRGELLGAQQEVFLFPQGITHRVTKWQDTPIPPSALKITGVNGGDTVFLQPLIDKDARPRGIPVLHPKDGAHAQVAWG
jgi:hypothetical protein